MEDPQAPKRTLPRVGSGKFCHCAGTDRVANQHRATESGGIDDRGKVVDETRR